VPAQVRYATYRASVRFTVGDGHAADGFTRPHASSPVEPVDELALRRRFDALVTPHLPALHARARQLCRSHCDAEDIVQDALLRAFRARTQVEDPDRIRWWLLKIVTNRFIDLIRIQRNQALRVDMPTEELAMPAPDDPAPWDHIGLDELRAAVDQLPDDVRETYRMFALDGSNYEAIGDAQRIPTATVGTRIFRARKRLRQLLTSAPAPGKRKRGPR
jgi:RNA polymerase sigma-70 factor (ECF subfamily)